MVLDEYSVLNSITCFQLQFKMCIVRQEQYIAPIKSYHPFNQVFIPREDQVGACQISFNIQYMAPIVSPLPVSSSLFCHLLQCSVSVFIPIAWSIYKQNMTLYQYINNLFLMHSPIYILKTFLFSFYIILYMPIHKKQFPISFRVLRSGNHLGFRLTRQTLPVYFLKTHPTIMYICSV